MLKTHHNKSLEKVKNRNLAQTIAKSMHCTIKGGKIIDYNKQKIVKCA